MGYHLYQKLTSQLGEKLKKEKTARKKRIPKKKREEVWTSNNGKSLSAKCFCCNIQELNGLGSWECGHIKSEANGGELNTENLKPTFQNAT